MEFNYNTQLKGPVTFYAFASEMKQMVPMSNKLNELLQTIKNHLLRNNLLQELIQNFHCMKVLGNLWIIKDFQLMDFWNTEFLVMITYFKKYMND